jgi:catechol 2,3-dioxygenase-like lactoylglutathione lyase family enzyme
MSTIETRANSAGLDIKLEVVVLPVTDVDRAKEFYSKLGWRLDADRAVGDEFRLVQFTPAGSACSIQFGVGLTESPPGSAQSMLVVPDVEATRNEIAARGVDVTDVYHCATGTACRFRDAEGVYQRVTGPEPSRATYSSFASFNDPDGNAWVLQEVTARLAGRIDPGSTTFTSASDLEGALRRASAAHGEHEKRIGHADPNWPSWYAEYIVAEYAGTELPK